MKRKLFFPPLFIMMILSISMNMDLINAFVSLASHAVRFSKCRSLLVLKMKKPSKVIPAINVEGKGFARTTKPEKRLTTILKKTDAGYARKFEGHYKRSVHQHWKIFDSMLFQAQAYFGSFNANDIYARSDQSSKTFFIGRIIYPVEYQAIDAIKTIEVILYEFAKTLQPVELGSMLTTEYPQLLFSRIGFTDETVFNDYDKEMEEEKTESAPDDPSSAVTSLLCRYYHFNPEAKFFDFEQVGFQPVKDLSETRKYRGEVIEQRRKRMDKLGIKKGDESKFLLTHDDGSFWTSEERRQVQQPAE
jgi:hypothetical protein